MKVLVCFGTRPEAIKMAPVIYELKKTSFQIKICVTAQHREMLDQVLFFFDIKPDFDLNIMKPNQSLNTLSSRILLGIDEVLIKESFDLILVHGDTTSSTMISLAAFHRGIKIGHIEAGLRTYNKYAPFPEEMNRQLTGRLADLHFSPTQTAKENLLKENVVSTQIYVTGNTVIDALNIAKHKIDNGFVNNTIKNLKQTLNFDKKFILVTGHRRENFGNNLEKICTALIEISQREDVLLVFPVHLNPKVETIVHKMLGNQPNIILLPPLDYPSLVWLLSKSSLVISDSGGIQEEAPTFGVPILVTREVTERSEGMHAGCSFLVGSSVNEIVLQANTILNRTKYKLSIQNPYGDGTAAKQIVDIIKNNF